MSWFARHAYWRRLRWPIRILAWLVTAGLASLAGWQYAVLGPLAFETWFVVMLVRDDHRLGPISRPVPAENSARVAAIRAEHARLAALPRVPSPGGWSPPDGVLPAWNWLPPPGVEPRMDRVPAWVRLWYGTPLVDRYAHAWLWHQGGYDVVPPEAWTTPPSF